MGQCYTVIFDLKFNETGRDRFNRKLRQYLENLHADDTDEAPEINTPVENIKWLTDDIEIEHDDIFRLTGVTEFNASYSWEDALTDGFEYALTECEDESFVKILPDDGGYIIKVHNGEPVYTWLPVFEGGDEYYY